MHYFLIFLFFLLFLLTGCIQFGNSEKIYQKINDVDELYKIFLNNPESIEYAQINITRSKEEKTLCCINILGENVVCSFYDIEIEYHGKMSSKSIMIECNDIDNIYYYIVYKFDLKALVVILGGVLVVILAVIILVIAVLKKSRRVLVNTEPVAASAGV